MRARIYACTRNRYVYLHLRPCPASLMPPQLPPNSRSARGDPFLGGDEPMHAGIHGSFSGTALRRQNAGFWQEARNLSYVLFYNSSHMVPFDYARRTRDMLDRFMGVDISSIGGVPTDSRIDGEKGLETSVGGHPNSTTAEAAEEERLQAAKWHAYYKSGEIVLVIVIIAAGAWGYYVWKDRRKRAGYKGIFGAEPMSLGGARESVRGNGMGLESFRHKRGNRDVEAADFDESELDELHVRTPTEDMDRDRYSVGSASDDEEAKHGNGIANGKGKMGEKR